MHFGISTHLYHDERLSRDHLIEIAAYGFDTVELFATPSHFDYHDRATVEALRTWLEDAGLSLHGIHAPIVERYASGPAGASLSIAAPETAARTRAVRETEAALEIARHTPTGFLVVHVGSVASAGLRTADNDRTAARRSLEEIHALATSVAVRVAMEVIPNDLSSASSLVQMLEDELDLPGMGICLDFGHAFLMGDLVDAIEIASGHLITTHVHDNHGTRDEHLVPFDGTIDWAHALMAISKIGYDGTFLFELGNISTPREVLARAREARARFERMLGR